MKQVSSLFALLALATFSVLPFRAQQFVAHYLPTQSQLPMASIHCIWQDREGYLWYGAEGGGLCRDNGYQIDVFRPVCTANPSEACQVHCLAELASGDILFGTSDGLFRINKHDYQISRIALDSLPQRIDALMADREGHLWAASKGCIYQCQADGQVTEAHDCRLRGERTSVSSFYEDSRGTIFALLTVGVPSLRPSSSCLVSTAPSRFFCGLCTNEWSIDIIKLHNYEDVTYHPAPNAESDGRGS